MSTLKVNNLPLSSEQCRAARALLGWTQEQLADASRVSRSTIASFERNERQPTEANVAMLRLAFERAGLEIIDENGGGEGLRFKVPRRRSG